MKPLLSIATLMLFFTTLCHSQNIDIADFLQLRGKTKNVVESRLNSINIGLYDEDEIGNGKTHYTYQKNGNDDGMSTSFQWIDFIYEKDVLTTLDYDSLAEYVQQKAERYIIYADNCLLPETFMKAKNIEFKKIPRDITRF